MKTVGTGNSRVLFLDDQSVRAEHFLEIYPDAVWVTTSEECKELLAENWDVVSLDHDLGGEVYVDSDRADCGMEVVRWLTEHKPEHLSKTHFIVHSLNADAARQMLESLRNAGYNCTYRPFINVDW